MYISTDKCERFFLCEEVDVLVTGILALVVMHAYLFSCTQMIFDNSCLDTCFGESRPPFHKLDLRTLSPHQAARKMPCGTKSKAHAGVVEWRPGPRHGSFHAMFLQHP
ncbi:hypothetical protein EJ04DRAFT_158325 [Polyplosphaeria fusca]|uniref:Uncharacterized protein n=1 Tax=Polyplosphaeria fusca TaxID=682080 RepID=A0A9P4QGK0_9PLEO|nr:hypothetical protein EJ04DRAFT_158325 [Polyplosphaeria fusca]